MTEIHPSAVVDGTADLGDGVRIGPHCVVGPGASIGAGTVLDAGVVVAGGVSIGLDNHLFPHCAIGCKPQLLNLAEDADLGAVRIGDRNNIREQVTIHPAMSAGAFTTVGNDNLLMVGVHVGHDCTIEDNVVLSNFVQISGHCRIGTGAWLSGMVVLHQFVTVGRWAYAAGFAGLNHDVPPFLVVSGHYPPRIRGVNRRGMSRAGLDEEQQNRIFDAYRKLYRKDGTLLGNALALARDDSLDENVRAIVETITRSSRHRFGRYLETFRD